MSHHIWFGYEYTWVNQCFHFIWEIFGYIAWENHWSCMNYFILTLRPFWSLKFPLTLIQYIDKSFFMLSKTNHSSLEWYEAEYNYETAYHLHLQHDSSSCYRHEFNPIRLFEYDLNCSSVVEHCIRLCVQFPGNTHTDNKMYSLNALQVTLDKSIC